MAKKAKKKKGQTKRKNGRGFSESARDYETRIKETAGFHQSEEEIAG
jgi:hypothetical protein